MTAGPVVAKAVRKWRVKTVTFVVLLAAILIAGSGRIGWTAAWIYLVVVSAGPVAAYAERRRELAIRSALGAKTGQLVTLVARQGLAPVILGAALGLLSAWSGARILEQFLFEVKLHDPAIYAGAGAFTILIAALACCLPARRIGEAAPATVLQSE